MIGDLTVGGKPDEPGKRAASDSCRQSQSLRAAPPQETKRRPKRAGGDEGRRSVVHEALVTYYSDRKRKDPSVFQFDTQTLLIFPSRAEFLRNGPIVSTYIRGGNNYLVPW